MAEQMLQGRVAVVTGGSSGIGRAIVEEFTRAGAVVASLDVNAGVSANAGVSEFACDVTSEESVDATFAAVKAKVGVPEILVNCAGIAHVGTLASTQADDFDRLFQVNVRGTYLVMRAAIGDMEAAQRGVIVNLCSIAATAGLPDRFAYSMTKGAVRSMTLSVARDYLHKGIRCNCISPARVHTPFVDRFLANSYPGREAEQFAKLASAQPIGRMGTPEEIAKLALYLASDAASFITGQDYAIDGGYMNLR